MTRWDMVGLLAVICIVVLVVLGSGKLQDMCHARGGEFVRALWGYSCVKVAATLPVMT